MFSLSVWSILLKQCKGKHNCVPSVNALFVLYLSHWHHVCETRALASKDCDNSQHESPACLPPLPLGPGLCWGIPCPDRSFAVISHFPERLTRLFGKAKIQAMSPCLGC